MTHACDTCGAHYSSVPGLQVRCKLCGKAMCKHCIAEIAKRQSEYYQEAGEHAIRLPRLLCLGCTYPYSMSFLRDIKVQDYPLYVNTLWPHRETQQAYKELCRRGVSLDQALAQGYVVMPFLDHWTNCGRWLAGCPST